MTVAGHIKLSRVAVASFSFLTCKLCAGAKWASGAACGINVTICCMVTYRFMGIKMVVKAYDAAASCLSGCRALSAVSADRLASGEDKCEIRIETTTRKSLLGS